MVAISWHQILVFRSKFQQSTLQNQHFGASGDIQDRYGIEVGKPANFIVLQGEDDVAVIREQADVLWSVRGEQVLMQREPATLKQTVSLA